jgi:DNA (cytosine-5)-methyltransferase 1
VIANPSLERLNAALSAVQLRLPTTPLIEPPLAARGFSSIELFTGAGGLALGTHAAGFHHEALVEWNADACNTLRTNIRAGSVSGIGHWSVVEGDVRDFIRKLGESNLGALDLVAGGAPCQPFSIGGKHRGIDDRRNMIPFFTEIVQWTQPKAFILENVRGLLRPGFREYFDYVILCLTFPWAGRLPDETWLDHAGRLGKVDHEQRSDDPTYRVQYALVNAADYGVPQVRHRVFIVGLRDDIAGDFQFPEPSHSFDSLLFEQWMTGEYWERHEISTPQSVPAEFVSRVKQLRTAPCPNLPWCTVRDAVGDLPIPTREDAIMIRNHRLNPGARAYVGHSGSSWDLPSKALKAGDHGVPGGENTLRTGDVSIRYYTVREAARIQAFPDEWVFEGTWSETMRQLGNAVPVTLASAVAGAVARHLAANGSRWRNAS